MSIPGGLIKNNVDIQGTLKARNTTVQSLNASSANISGNSTLQTLLVNGNGNFVNLLIITSLGDVGVDGSGAQSASIQTLGGIYAAKTINANNANIVNNVSAGGNLIVSGTSNQQTINCQNLNTTSNITSNNISANGQISNNQLFVNNSQVDAQQTGGVWSAAIQTQGGIFAQKSIISLLNGYFGKNLQVIGTINSVNIVNSTNISTPTLLISDTATIQKAIFTGAVECQSTLLVRNILSCTSDAMITGNTSMQGNLTVQNGLTVTNAVSFSNSLTVNANTALNTLNTTSLLDVNTTSLTAANTMNGGLIVQKQIYSPTSISSLVGNFTSLNSANASITSSATLNSVITLSGITALTPIIQGGANIPINALRIRTNDTTNTSARISIANNGMGNNYYDSGITMYSLGSSETSTNYERVAIGINANGVYLNYLYGGTGIPRNFNILNGAMFTSGGNLALQSLNTGGIYSSTNTTDSTSSTSASSINTAGGLSVAKSANIGNMLNVQGPATLASSLTIGGTTTFNGPVSFNFTSITDLIASGVISAMGVTDSTSPTSNSSLRTAGGLSVAKSVNIGANLGIVGTLNSTNTTDSSSSTSISAINTLGGLSVAKSAYIGSNLAVTGTSILNLVNSSTLTLSDVINFPNTLTIASVQTSTNVIQGGASIPINALRIRTNDTTNTSARITIANSAMGNNYYDSGITMYSLGSSDTSTNYERVAFGINNGGVYLNYLFGGTGTAKSFNIFGGSTFTTGGNLNLSGVLVVAGNATLATLTAAATTLASLNVTNTSTLNALTAAATTLSSLNVTNTSTLNSLTAAATTLASLNVTNASTLNSLTAAATTLSSLNVTNATTLNSLTATSSISSAGTLTINGNSNLATVTASTITTSDSIVLPNTMTFTSATMSTNVIQGGSQIAVNAFRVRTNDTTNTSARINIANSAMGNNYYDSGFTMYSLGSSDTSTNYERMALGINNGGGYLNYLYTGTGTAKSLNIFGGSIFTTGGNLNLSGVLGVVGLATLSSLKVNGQSNLANTAISGTLSVTGNSTLSTLSATNTSVNGTLGITGQTTFGAQLNYPNTYYTLTAQSSLPVSQGGTGIPGNVWRVRTNDNTNTGVRMSLGNAGATSFYDSQLSFYGLGVIEGTSGNTERLIIGNNGSSGPFINQLYTGTGIARPLNIYNGALFSAGGALSLGSSLNVTGATTLGVLTATNGSLSSLNVSGTSTLAGLSATNTNISGTLGVSGNTTLSTLSATNTVINGSMNITGQTNIGGFVVYPSNLYTYTSSISGGNTFRYRSLDATNTTVVNSIANVNATSSYTSLLAFFSLGNTETNTTNTESMYIGATANGGVLMPAAAGTGVLTKPLNIYGTSMVNNGLVTHPNGLTVSAGNITQNGITNVAPSGATYTTTLPSALPTGNNMVLTSSTPGVQSWAPNTIIYTGDGSSVAPTQITASSRTYVFTQTIASGNNTGQLTFYLTSNGTSSGTAIFTNVNQILDITLKGRPVVSGNNTALSIVDGGELSRTSTAIVAGFTTNNSGGIVLGGNYAGNKVAPSGTICTCTVLATV